MMTDSEFREFIARIRPYIPKAALAARIKAERSGDNSLYLYLVQKEEQERLHFAAWDFKEYETVIVPRSTGVPMTSKEFEYYVLNLIGLSEYPNPASGSDQEPG